MTEQNFGETFWITVLLSGGIGAGEEAMMHAIRQVHAEGLPSRDIHHLSLMEAMRNGTRPTPVPEYPQAVLAPELRRILELPAHLRRSFVLRILAGFSREECDAMNVFDTDEAVAAAARELARMRESGSAWIGISPLLAQG